MRSGWHCLFAAAGVLGLTGADGPALSKQIMSADGKVQVSVPARWEKLKSEELSADIQLVDKVDELYLLVESDFKEDFNYTSYRTHGNVVLRRILRALDNAYVEGKAVAVRVDNRPALQAEVHGSEQGIKVAYLLTVVDGRDAYHVVLAWASRSRMKRNAKLLRAIAASLKEIRPAVLRAHDQALDAKALAEEARREAAAADKATGREPAFPQADQLLADATKAFGRKDYAKARRLFDRALTRLNRARDEAGLYAKTSEAQEAWAAALAREERELLAACVPDQAAAARAKASQAQAKRRAGDLAAACTLFQEACQALKAATDRAARLAPKARAVPVVAKLEEALRNKDKLAAESFLARLGTLVPSDRRLAGFRRQARGLPWPKTLSINLGGDVKIEFVYIPAGTFTMGSSKGRPDEKPAHKVTISKPFYLGRYEVTRRQWHTLMGDDPESRDKPRRPAFRKTWPMAQEFLQKLSRKAPYLSFRLPTEAEWEYACRAGTNTRYFHGDSASGVGEFVWHQGNCREHQPAGTRKPNPWGLYDMLGNTEEWCQDWYAADYYAKSPKVDPTGPKYGDKRVLRGGSGGHSVGDIYCAKRYPCGPTDLSYYGMGFRAACQPAGRN